MGHLVQYGAVGRGRQVPFRVQKPDALQLAIRVKLRRAIKHAKADARHIVPDVGVLAGGHIYRGRGNLLVVHHHGDEVELVPELLVDPPAQLPQGALSLGRVDGGRIPECELRLAQLQRGDLVIPRFYDDGCHGCYRHHSELRRRTGDAGQAGGDERQPLAQAVGLSPAAIHVADSRDGGGIGVPDGGGIARHIPAAAIGEGRHGLELQPVPDGQGRRWRRDRQAGHHGG
ncbi:hypothetical protein D3C80_1321010 [compost metagenome]